MSRDQDGNVDFSAWNVVNASSSEVMESGAHSLNKMLIRCAYLGYSATGSGCVGLAAGLRFVHPANKCSVQLTVLQLQMRFNS